MRAHSSCLLALLLAACAAGPTPRAPAPSPSALPPVSAKTPLPTPSPAPTADPASLSADDEHADAHASNAFTAKLYARLKRAPGNVMISGTSARHALALAALGARGDTAREMLSTLEVPTDPAKQVAVAKAETAAWQDARGSAELVLADRLWSDKALTLKDDFTSAASAAFGASAATVDFANAPDVARRSINAWVAEQTSNKVPDLLPEGMVDTRTRLLVTDAIYFKARWSAPFTPSATKEEPFTTARGRAAKVPTMHDTALHRFAQVGTTKLLVMRYSGARLAMLIALPDDVAGLAKLEESLSADTFEAWTKALAPQRVAISLPRFAFKWGGPLDVALQDLGMRAAFSSKADFSGIAEPSVQVSHVIQKTWVSLDENGTEAAAASGVAMSVTAALSGPIADFKADHPFLFFVYDDKRGRILFAGRINDPKP